MLVGFTAPKMLKDSRIALPLGIAMVFLLFLPGTSSADTENLYVEGYSSSVVITNPSNAYGAPDGIMAESTDKEKWGVPQRWPLLVTMAVIISVLTYMELLVRRQRGFTRD